MYSTRSSSDTAGEHACTHCLTQLAHLVCQYRMQLNCAHTQSRGVPHIPGGGAKELVGGLVVGSGRSSSNTVSKGVLKCMLEPGSEERTAQSMLHSKGTDGAPSANVLHVHGYESYIDCLENDPKGSQENLSVGEKCLYRSHHHLCTGTELCGGQPIVCSDISPLVRVRLSQAGSRWVGLELLGD